MKYLIIGGVAGGATAAARIRRADEHAEIILVEKGQYISYANCGLPYYIGGVIQEREKLFVQTPEAFGKRFAIDVRTENEVISINTDTKTVDIRKATAEIYTESYDKLLLSPGATPILPPLKGIDNEGIFTLRNVVDTDQIKTYITEKQIKNAVIVGAGFIGLEMAENIHSLGANVSIVEMGNQVMAPVDFSIASHIHEHLSQKNINLFLGESVESFEKTDDGIQVIFKSGKRIPADIVILSIGVRPATELAKSSNLRIGESGGIYVDEYLQTSQKDIYAVGDAIEFPHPLTTKPWLNYLANPANRQGRIVADNMVFGNTTKYEGAIGTAIAKVFDMTVATTGLAAKRLQQLGIEYLSSTTHSNSHASYYPDALPLSVKLTFDAKSGKIYGGQIVGYDGVDKRIDQLALLIKQGGTITDLMQLEHAYAPPFSSAKDPIAIAGYVANNVKSGVMPILTWREVSSLDLNTACVIDVRTADEFSFGSLKGAINIPLDDIRARLLEIPKDKEIILVCGIGQRGYLAQRILMQRGFKRCRNLSGGLKTYNLSSQKIKNSSLQANNTENKTMNEERKTIRVDACGLQCPGPILKVKQSMDTLAEGERLEIVSTDAGFARDTKAWCKSTANMLVSNTSTGGKYTVVIEKGGAVCEVLSPQNATGKTFILFSNDFDKALATFVLANGAAATGQKVTVFCTFWGLNVIKKAKKPQVVKDVFGKMFSFMLPSSSKELSLSKMNFFGMGSKMMRYMMKNKGIDSLESLCSQAMQQGVEIIACQMTMDMMGIQKEELFDEVTIGGVATYMERADESNINLFI